MADRFSVSCPKCGLGVELEMGIFGWKTEKCPKCREKITFEKSRMKIVHCKGCDNDVVYDLARQNPCPICKRELFDNDEDHISVVCPECEIVVELEKGLFGWKNTTCPKCGKKIRMKDQETQLMECPTCKRTVEYNLKRRNNCPSCNGPLYNPASLPQRLTVECPFCQMDVQYSAGDTNVVCPVCRQGFNPEEVVNGKAPVITTKAPDIRMTEEIAPDRLVWKHPMSGKPLPLSARIIAKAGMTAVVVQGDQQAFAVNGQSVMLSETSLKADAYAYGENKEERHVYVEIYYVRNAIPKTSLAWGGLASLVDSHNHVDEFAMNGTCELAPIVDHAAFLRWVEFNENVTAQEFAIQRDARGVETVGNYARAISKAVRPICSEALRRVRDRKGLMPAMLHTCADEIIFEVQRLANEELRRWGVEIHNVVLDQMELVNGKTYADPLLARAEGRLDWTTASIPVHLKDKPQAMARLRMDGSLYIVVTDAERLKSSTAAARWTAGSNENVLREEVGSHVGELLGSMFTSIFQSLIEDMNPPLEMLSTYAGYLKAQAAQLLNASDELLAQHGMSAQNLVLNVKVVEKSSLYALEEQTDLTISESEVKEKLYEYEQELMMRRLRGDSARQVEISQIGADTATAVIENEKRAAAARTEADIAGMENQARKENEQARIKHEQAMAELERAAQEDEARRRYSFAAWQEENRAAAAREQAAFESARSRQDFANQTQRDQAMHDRAMHDIMRAVEESDQTWREKLDSYARLQRNIAAQDKLDQRSADHRANTDDQVYTGFQNLRLSEDVAKVAASLEKDAAMVKEDLEKARFTRDLELRRQRLAEEMQRLEAEYQQENKRHELENENETLRLMLEYMAKQGEQQIAQTSIQALMAQAKAEADRAAAQQQEAAAQQREVNAQLRADVLHKEQVTREDVMAARAHELAKEMLETQRRLAEMEKENERAYNSGRAMVDAKSRQYQDEQIDALVKEMDKLRTSLKDTQNTSATLTVGSDMAKWLEGLMKGASAAAQPVPQAAPVYSAQPGVFGGATRRCPFCQTEMSLNAIMCPNCRR